MIGQQDIGDIVSEALCEEHGQAAQYFDSITQNTLPSAKAFSPTKVPVTCLSNIVMWHAGANDDFMDYRCTVMGTNVVVNLGYDLTQKKLRECTSSFCKGRFYEVLSKVYNERCIGLQQTIIPVSESKTLRTYQSTYPLVDDNDKIVKMVMLLHAHAFSCKLHELFDYETVHGEEWRGWFDSMTALKEARVNLAEKQFQIS